MAAVAATVTTDLAAPDSHKGARVAIRATPRQDVSIGGLDNGKYMAGALVGHCGILRFEIEGKKWDICECHC